VELSGLVQVCTGIALPFFNPKERDYLKTYKIEWRIILM
jgi:hypothetical protein